MRWRTRGEARIGNGIRKWGESHPNWAMAITIMVCGGLAISSAAGIMRIQSQEKMSGLMVIVLIISVDILAVLFFLRPIMRRRRQGGHRRNPSLSTGAFAGLVGLAILIRLAPPLLRHSLTLAVAGFAMLFFAGLWVLAGQVTSPGAGGSD